MKRSALVLLLAASVSCFAQNSNNTKSADLDHLLPQATQAGCPVMFTSASITPKGRYLPVSSKKDTGNANGDLNLGFRNMSGKQIQSIGLAAELKVKRNRYDLDATTIDIHLTVAGLVEPNENDLSRTLALTVNAFGLEQVRLEHVNYTDGSIWTIKNNKGVCSFTGQGGALLTQLK